MIYLFNHTDPKVEIFEKYRSIQENYPSKLSKNYSKQNFDLTDQKILSFYCKDEKSEPSIFSSIYRKSWWPLGVYRILNRTWQYPRVVRTEKTINDGLYSMIQAQLEWCKLQPDFRTAIISRSNNLRLFGKMCFDLEKKNIKFDFIGRVWVCESSNPTDCYQHVIYHGDSSVFDHWCKYES